ncbi:Pyridoxine 4-dehydrogenase [Mycoblastus sanguinarius]|nr:Pyridoxine 4-dehydrogenase [Mycoblastus sanguinarius]
MATITGKPVGRTGYGMMSVFYGTPTANSLQLLNRYFTKYPEDADRVVLSVKGGNALGQMRIDGSEKNIRRSIDECLELLGGKKFLDIFEPARQDATTPLEETVNTMAQYVREGKIGGIGLSEVTADRIKEAAALHSIAAVEVEMSLHSPEILTNGVASTCAELSIPIVAYSPLGRGLLTAQMTKPSDLDSTDIRHHLPRFAPGNMEKNAEMANEVKKIAKKKECTPAQVALAWVRSFSGKDGMPIIVPIPGSTTEERAVENTCEVSLNAEELKEIEEILKRAEVLGARYGSH